MLDDNVGAAQHAGDPPRGVVRVGRADEDDDKGVPVLPLVSKYGAAVVAISNDETGISMDPDVRFAVAKRIVERAADHGIPASDIVVDPLVMPIGAPRRGRPPGLPRSSAGCATSSSVNTTCGASNVSFGLPNREGINGAFLPMAIASGMTSAITNPMRRRSRQRSWPPTC